MLRGAALGVAFSPDGRSLLAVDDRGNVRAWPMPEPTDEPIERLIRRIQIRTGLKLDTTHEVAVLDADDWQRGRTALDDASSGSAPEDDSAAWHEASARDALALGNSFAARWHLDRLIAGRPADGSLHAHRARILLLAGSPELAEADLTRALELGPRDRILDALMHHAEDFRAGGRHHDALRLLDRVVARRPATGSPTHSAPMCSPGSAAPPSRSRSRTCHRARPDAAFLLRLAAERCDKGRWQSAALLYDQVIDQGPSPHDVWTESAIAHLMIDDDFGFRRVCAIMRSRHPAAIPELFLRPQLASVCALAPGGLGEDGKARGWIESLLAELRPITSCDMLISKYQDRSSIVPAGTARQSTASARGSPPRAVRPSRGLARAGLPGDGSPQGRRSQDRP